MTIKAGDFIKVSYTAKLEDGTVIDTTIEEVAKEHGIYSENARYGDIALVVGEGHVVKGLDEALVGKEVGFRGEVVVPPEKAFGEHNPEKKEVVSITKFKERPEIGQRVRVGEKVGTVERIIGRRVIVDLNHPLAGKTLTFDVEVRERIEDIAEKIKALFLIATGIDVDAVVDEKKAIVNLPKGAYFNQYFTIGKFSAINAIFKYLDIEEIDLVEKFTKEEEKPIIEAVEEAKSEEGTEGEKEGGEETKRDKKEEKAEG